MPLIRRPVRQQLLAKPQRRELRPLTSINDESNRNQHSFPLMFSKPIQTIRVGNIGTEVTWEDLVTLFSSQGHNPTTCGSLCPTSQATQVATLSFSSESEARKALSLNGKNLGNSMISVDRDFFGFTVLAAPKDPPLE